ncbi:dihydrolipoamide acetyltransferase family protein [Agrococcus sediminis]|uniref:dihydrolipoamide acetyltransferase family protein n=1 Tax=Agrococcus sediminis TaxID=2599924 RepID=UPI003433B852
MATEVRIPTTGNAGEDAVVTEWHVAVGEAVAAGAPLLTIETAKSTLDIDAPESGTLLQRGAEVGDEIAEFAVVAVLGDTDETIAPSQAAPAGPTPGSEAPATATEDGVMPPVGDASPSAHQDASDSTSTITIRGGKRVSASPRARRIADEHGVELGRVAGSGPLGRILAADVLAAARSHAPARATDVAPDAPTAAASPAPFKRPAATSEDGVLVPVRGARKITAQRMQESLSTTAQVTLTRYADGTRLFEWVGRLRDALGDEGPRIGVNEAIMYAAARTVGRHPAANSWFGWDGIRQFERVQLGFAVDTDEALLVPVIRDAHALRIGELATAVRDAVAKAKSGRLTADDMSGGTFTVSNLGALGVHWFTPVLNPPQTCILGVGAAHQAAPGAARLVPLSLTFDHRAIDGAAAARLLADLARAIEHIDVLDAL